MAVNIFGPFGPGIRESTIRPEAGVSGSSVDTFFSPCINEDPTTGTKVSYRWLNFMTANMRRAVRGMGVAESESDDDLLLKAIQAATAQAVTNVYNAVLPEMRSSGLDNSVPSGVLTKMLVTGAVNTIPGLTLASSVATVATGGLYLITGNVLTSLFNTSTGFNVEISVSTTAGQFSTVLYQPAGSPVGVMPALAVPVRLGAGGTAAIYYFHNSGRTETVQATFNMVRLSA